MSGVFISYSRRDAQAVGRIHKALSEAGREPWIDWSDIPPAAKWMSEVYAAIDAADAFVFVVSTASIASETCGLELGHAIDHSKRLIPIVVGEVDPNEVRAELRLLNWIFCRPEDVLESAVSSLFDAIDTDLEWVRNHSRLLVNAREWEGHAEDESYLLQGSNLKDALSWLTTPGLRKEPAPSPLHCRYVQASQEAEARELARITRLYNQALARQLTAQAHNIELENADLLERSALLAVESVRRDPTAEGIQLLSRLIPILPRRVAVWQVSPTPGIIEFSPDGQFVLTAAGRLSPLESESAKSMEDYVNREDLERGLVYLNSLGQDPSYWNARLWEASSGREVACFSHAASVVAAAYSRDGRSIATLSGGKFRLWDVATLQQRQDEVPHELRKEPRERRRARHEALRPRLGRVLNQLSRAEIEAQLRNRGIEPRKDWHKSHAVRALIDHLFEASSDCTNDGRYWFEKGSTSSDSSRLSMRAVIDGHEVSRVTRSGQIGFAVDPMRPRVVTVSWGTVEVWEMAGEWTVLALEDKLRVERMLFSVDGKLLATREGFPLVRKQVWNLETGTPVLSGRARQELEAQLGEPRPMDFGAKRHVRLGVRSEAYWENYDTSLRVRLGAENCQTLELSGDSTIEDVRFGPDDALVLVRHLSQVRVWAVPAGDAIGWFDLSDNTALSSSALSADGSMVAVGDYQGRVGVWRVPSCEQVASFAHEDQVLDAVFSADGKYLITASEDRTVRIWDISRNVAVGRWACAEAVKEILLSPDGALLATRTGTGKVAVRRWRPDDLVDLAVKRLTRRLSKDEWTQYLGEEPYVPGSIDDASNSAAAAER